MKTIEEKAKCYDKAIERAKGLIDFSSDSELKTLEYVFPELKESSDEKIKNVLIGWINLESSISFGDTFDGFSKEQILAWLERQGDYSKLVGEMKKRKELLSKEKENATSDNDKLSLGGRIAMLEELLVFVNEEQGEPVEINPNEFYSRLNKLLKQFESLPKEELISSLSFYLNVVKNGYLSENVEPTDYNSIDPHFGKPVDNLEPKFKVGDYVVDNCGYVWRIEGIINQFYILEGIDGGESRPTIEWVNKTFHLWTIADAKNGDVLAYVTDEEDLWIMIYWSLYKPYEGHVHYHALLVNDNFSDKGTCCICINDLKPATKEQCDLLFQKMKEAGYEWNAEKKELKEIEQKPPIVNFKARDWYVNKVDGKIYNAKFMEEPLTNKKRRLEIEKAAMSATGIIEQEEWFIKGAEWSDKNPSYISSEKQGEQKSFDYENANIPQKYSTWSEEDKHWMQKIIDFMNHPDLIKATPTLAKDTINWLKSLKDRVQPQSKQEWSEEDESNFQMLIDVIKENKYHTTDYEHMIYYKLLTWFKSLKDRYICKPSDEQMKVCKEVYADLLSAKGFDVGTINSELNRLEEKLK